MIRSASLSLKFWERVISIDRLSVAGLYFCRTWHCCFWESIQIHIYEFLSFTNSPIRIHIYEFVSFAYLNWNHSFLNLICNNKYIFLQCDCWMYECCGIPCSHIFVITNEIEETMISVQVSERYEFVYVNSYRWIRERFEFVYVNS